MYILKKITFFSKFLQDFIFKYFCFSRKFKYPIHPWVDNMKKLYKKKKKKKCDYQSTRNSTWTFWKKSWKTQTKPDFSLSFNISFEPYTHSLLSLIPNLKSQLVDWCWTVWTFQYLSSRGQSIRHESYIFKIVFWAGNGGKIFANFLRLLLAFYLGEKWLFSMCISSILEVSI